MNFLVQQIHAVADLVRDKTKHQTLTLLNHAQETK